MSGQVRVIEVNDFEHRVMMRILSDKRNQMIAEDESPEDVSDLLLKVIDAPVKKHRWERCHDER